MDRRQKKTRAAIFAAFTRLLEKKKYSAITVQQIIDEADIGRTTFYAHFETRDDLLKELCSDLFGHITQTAADHLLPGQYSDGTAPASVFCHLFCHLKENGSNILGLLSGENNELFTRYFRDSLNELFRTHLTVLVPEEEVRLPEGYLINHLSASLVETVLWWVRTGMKQTPDEITDCFLAVVPPFQKEPVRN